MKRTIMGARIIAQNENLIANCGLYCGDCHGFSGKILDLARDLRKELRASRYDKFAGFISPFSFGKDFKEFMRSATRFLAQW